MSFGKNVKKFLKSKQGKKLSNNGGFQGQSNFKQLVAGQGLKSKATKPVKPQKKIG